MTTNTLWTILICFLALTFQKIGQTIKMFSLVIIKVAYEMFEQEYFITARNGRVKYIGNSLCYLPEIFNI